MELDNLDNNEYMKDQIEDIERLRQEESARQGREISLEEATGIWVDRGRAKDYCSYYLQTHGVQNHGARA